jgi:hypothetical protein
MSQPPYPPPGGAERPGEGPGRGFALGSDQTTLRLGPSNPGQREATQQFTPTGPWPPRAQPTWGQPPRKSNTVLVALVVAASLVLLGVLVALVVVLARS